MLSSRTVIARVAVLALWAFASSAAGQRVTRASVIPSSIDLGSVVVPNGYRTVTIRIDNVGNTSLAGEFMLPDGSGFDAGTCVQPGPIYDYILPPETTCKYTITIDSRLIPQDRLGPGGTSLEFTYFDPFVEFVGHSTTMVSIPITWNGVAEPLIFDDSSPLRFGAAEVGVTTLPVVRVIRNVSPDTWNVVASVIASQQPNCWAPFAKLFVPGICENLAREVEKSYAISTEDCNPIAPFGSCTISIAFSPMSARTLAANIALGVDSEARQPVRVEATGQGIPRQISIETVLAREYFNATLDRHFLTASPVEQSLLNSGAIVGWQPTGFSFWVFPPEAAQPPGTTPVCRLYGSPDAGLDTHFYSPSPDECATVLTRWPNVWTQESPSVFYAYLPNALTGACPSNSSPIYRFYDGRPDADHRYLMFFYGIVALDWIAEGYGAPVPVGMCVPQ